jgi:hypothetical protein
MSTACAVVMNHALHELRVGGSELHLREIACLLRLTTRLASPGAPGCTIGGPPTVDAPQAVTATARAATIARKISGIRHSELAIWYLRRPAL